MAPTIEGDTPIAYYCGATCQKEHWKEHKPICRKLQTRAQLYRVVGLAEKLFYIYRELTWCKLNIQRIEKTDGRLTLRGEVHRDATWPEDYKVFPSSLVSSEEERKAILSFCGCIDGVQWMNEVVKGMLGDVVEKVSVIELKTKNSKLRTRMCPVSVDVRISLAFTFGDIIHEILKLELPSGEIFAVDIAGSQYGYDEPILPWGKYERTRITRIFESKLAPQSQGVVEVDDCSMQSMMAIDQKMSKGSNGVVNLDILQAMCFHIIEWQAGSGVSLKKLWKLSEQKFLPKREDLLDYVEWKFHTPPHEYFTVKGRKLSEQIKGKWDFKK
ncbi:hypothetical protein EG329_010075 [Mollisiaceae sp. DMI_Dod_QoI]|nr:hypothetical protein EG329_010075 [Helotiales sp. DMI_Dod_QoI]